MPRILPPDSELILMFRAGYTDKEIARDYGVTVAAVNKHRMRLVGPVKPIVNQVNDSLSVRWKVITGEDSRDQGAGIIKSLRVFLRRQIGDDSLNASHLAKAREFENRIRKNNVVVEYHPDNLVPWSYRPRRPEDGRLVVDWPHDLPFPSEEFRQALELPEETEEVTDDD